MTAERSNLAGKLAAVAAWVLAGPAAGAVVDAATGAGHAAPSPFSLRRAAALVLVVIAVGAGLVLVAAFLFALRRGAEARLVARRGKTLAGDAGADPALDAWAESARRLAPHLPPRSADAGSGPTAEDDDDDNEDDGEGEDDRDDGGGGDDRGPPRPTSGPGGERLAAPPAVRA